MHQGLPHLFGMGIIDGAGDLDGTGARGGVRVRAKAGNED